MPLPDRELHSYTCGVCILTAIWHSVVGTCPDRCIHSAVLGFWLSQTVLPRAFFVLVFCEFKYTFLLGDPSGAALLGPRVCLWSLPVDAAVSFPKRLCQFAPPLAAWEGLGWAAWSSPTPVNVHLLGQPLAKGF